MGVPPKLSDKSLGYIWLRVSVEVGESKLKTNRKLHFLLWVRAFSSFTFRILASGSGLKCRLCLTSAILEILPELYVVSRAIFFSSADVLESMSYKCSRYMWHKHAETIRMRSSDNLVAFSDRCYFRSPLLKDANCKHKDANCKPSENHVAELCLQHFISTSTCSFGARTCRFHMCLHLAWPHETSRNVLVQSVLTKGSFHKQG